MELVARITSDPAIRGGKPCIRGMRLGVEDIFGYLAAGMTEKELLGDFPELEHEDVLACFAFAANESQRRILTPGQ